MVWNWLKAKVRSSSSADRVLLDQLSDMTGIDAPGARVVARALPGLLDHGADLYAATNELMSLGVPRLTRGRAGQVATWVAAVARSEAQRRQWIDQGWSQAEWRCSGGSCLPRWRSVTADDLAIERAHHSLDRTVYPLDMGVLIDGEFWHPGTSPGCTCVAGPVIPTLRHRSREGNT